MKSAAEKVKKSDGAGFTEARPASFEVSNGKAGKGDQEGTMVDPAFRPLLRIQQLRTVIGHPNGSPRKYTFDEWTWVLKLLGEEQGQPQSPGGVSNISQPPGAKYETLRSGTQKAQWVWLDRESPLISGMDEPDWVLDKLLDCSEMELNGTERS